MMHRTGLSLALLLLPAIALATPTAGAPRPPMPSQPPLGQLTMKGADAATAIYADKCSNGANSEEGNRAKFIAIMLADPKSKLGALRAKLEKAAGPDYEVQLGEWTQSFHERDGCADVAISFSALVLVKSKQGNSHEVAANALVTIDDDVAADTRTLRLREITPLKLRTKP
jgi:hypothetical protein